MSVLDAVVISDLHLGSDVCRARRLERFLHEMPPTRRLVLNGDVLDSTSARLTRHHWSVLSFLRKLSDRLELTWLAGNHDHDAAAVAHLIGATFKKEHGFVTGGRFVLCAHGDLFDEFLLRRPWVTGVASVAYELLQKMSLAWAERLKRRSKVFADCCQQVKQRALAHARKRKADWVLCGHTHHAEREDGYANSGCWTEGNCHWLSVCHGDVRLHLFEGA